MKYILFIVGIFFSTIGLSYIIIYLNLLVMGFSFIDYLKYIFTRVECLLFFVGYIILMLQIFKGGKKWITFMIL